MNRRGELPLPGAAIAAAALLGVVANARLPAGLGAAVPGCDLLLPLAVLAACETRARRTGCAALGLLRDALTGGPVGLHALGYLLAGAFVRAIGGHRPVRSLRRLLPLVALALPVACAPHALWQLLDAGLEPRQLARELGPAIGATLLWSPCTALFALALGTVFAPARALRTGS
ncbi:MAG: hypothetical protein D6776_02400 [Planctomycetota bacterium]|nr:MAG: hypothetical protein D6776_02400 [Planctomycetota bacterium]